LRCSVSGPNFFTITAHTLKDSSEGWNAYHIAAAAHQPGLLYPAEGSLFVNNDPPLSFFLAGLIERFTTDAIIAGRILAFLSTIGTGIAIGLAACLMGAGKLQSLLAAILFWAAPWVIVHYSALNDPQMLGNFLDAVGLVLILRSPRNLVFIALSALFLTAALFVKPLFLGPPLALSIWLFVYERRSALLLAGFGFVFAAIGYGFEFFTLHIELLSQLFSPRVFAWSAIPPGQWLAVEVLPLLASLSLFRLKKDGLAFFAAVYAALAFGLGVVLSAFGSTGPMIDAGMAVALGAAVFLARGPVTGWTYPALGFTAAAGAGFSAGLGTGPLAAGGDGTALCHQFRHNGDQAPLRSGAVRDLDALLLGVKTGRGGCDQSHPGHWQGRRPGSDLTHLFESHYFSMIQLQTNSALMPPSPLWLPLVRNYYLEHQGNGLFLIPRFEPIRR